MRIFSATPKLMPQAMTCRWECKLTLSYTINKRETFERLNGYETPSEPNSGHTFGDSPNVHEDSESRQFVSSVEVSE